MSVENKNPFDEISDLVLFFKNSKEDLDIAELQKLREDMSLALFYLSDQASRAIANYEAKDYERKQEQARIELSYRSKVDEKTGRNFSTAESEKLARLELKTFEKNVVESLRQKERVRIIITAVKEILNSISSKINQLNRNQ